MIRQHVPITQKGKGMERFSSKKPNSLPFIRAYDFSASVTAPFCLCINTASLHPCRITDDFSIWTAEVQYFNTKALLMAFFFFYPMPLFRNLPTFSHSLDVHRCITETWNFEILGKSPGPFFNGVLFLGAWPESLYH